MAGSAMASSAARVAAPSSVQTGNSHPLSIGQVLARLNPEFPDLSPSKLRFLEAEGLVDPQRTASGYRKYSWDDVNRERVEAATLSNGDEVQIGKFRLVFIAGPRPEGEGGA